MIRWLRPLTTTLIACNALLGAASGCLPSQTGVSLKVARNQSTPADASVTINEEYIGPLGFVAQRGVRLPVGEHRVTVEKDGYFPFDALIVAQREPIFIEIELVPVPD